MVYFQCRESFCEFCPKINASTPPLSHQQNYRSCYLMNPVALLFTATELTARVFPSPLMLTSPSKESVTSVLLSLTG